MTDPAWDLYWHELDADAPADPVRPCPDDCMSCAALELEGKVER